MRILRKLWRWLSRTFWIDGIVLVAAGIGLIMAGVHYELDMWAYYVGGGLIGFGALVLAVRFLLLRRRFKKAQAKREKKKK
ncbi:MAG: hypothetical protein FWD89_03775 [Firmicutes bacterium]|nr:hypothetical protein [Bacillota bacterium]MCL2771402.1 hypothetical protein [Bacillota bacterium]